MKHLLFVGIICLFTGLIKPDNNDQIRFQCPIGWTNINYMCYKAVNRQVPWDIASDCCQRMQSELVKIQDYWTNKDVGGEALKNGLSEYWIGFNQLNNRNSSDQAHWSHGEETNIKKGFWDNYNPDMKIGKCSYQIQSNERFKWALGNCNEKKTFVCEKTACTVGTFMCENSRCIGQKQICDGKDDCQDASDELNCTQLCRYYETGSSGKIASFSNNANYRKNSFCLWKIRSDMGTSVKLTFSEFITEENTDVVEIYVGSLSESEAFFKYRLSGNNVTQGTYTSPNNMMIVKFMSDSSVEYKGFIAEWKTVSSNLKPVEIRAYPRGNLTVYDYGNNEQNTWTIRAISRRQIITLERIEMYLLDKDEVIVYNGDSLTSPILATYTSTDNPLMGPQFVQSTGEAITILLKSRGFFSNGRFIFTYQQGCEIEIKDKLSGEVMSPGYNTGENYPNSMDCKWYISIPSNQSYSLKFDSNYDIDTPDDGLYIYNIVNSGSKLLYNNTNVSIAPSQLKDLKGVVQITFTTNAVVNKKGFKAVFSKDCPDPNFNANTITTPADRKWHYGSTFDVSCQQGYSFYSEEFEDDNSTNESFISKISVEMACLKGGQWNVRTIPQCSKNYCGPVEPIKNGRVLNATGVLVGDVAQYSCVDGYTITGKKIVKCQENGKWETVPVCSATGCPSPSNITNGQVNVTNETGTSVGSIILYTCNAGYQIDGVPISQCQKSGKWSTNPPSCKILQCSSFVLEGKIPNSSIQPAGDVDVMQSKNVTCDNGYTLNGTSKIVCLEDQTFSTLPTCEDIDECQPSRNLSRCSQICVNTPGSYYCKCDKGYRLQADNVTCQDINECQINNADCEQICTNIEGSYECSCKEGYALYVQNYTIPGDSGKYSKYLFHLNHSCVPVPCPELGKLPNGYIQPQRQFSHFGDTFYFSCKIGFILKGAANVICLQNGSWSSILPTCEAAICTSSQNAHSDIPYLGFYNFSCEVKGKAKENRHRQCLYNPFTNTYQLLGDSYVCEQIDCGQPKHIPGSLDLNVTNTTFGSQYEIECSDLYRLKGNSSHGNNIWCGSDGQWNYGNLRCDGVLCDYPSVPAEGTVEVLGFTEGSIAIYNCTKEGYAPFNITKRKCVKANNKGLMWDQYQPTCVDVQPPTVKNGTCDESIRLDKYSTLNIPLPEFADNSGIFTVEINPKEAITGFVITRNITITYTAKDKEGYNVTCYKNIIVEDRPLQITCPSHLTEVLENSTETKKLVFNSNLVNVTGPDPYHITFTPKELNISDADIDSLEPVFVEAFNGKQRVNCTFYVDVQAKACSAVSRPQVQYATWKYTENSNVFICKDGYSYPESKLQKRMTAECNSSWNVPYTSCSKLENYAKFYANMTFVYSNDTAISDICAEELQTALLNMIIMKTKTLCSFLNNKPHPSPLNSTFKYIFNGSQINFTGLLTNKAKKPLEIYAEENCLKELQKQMSLIYYVLYTEFKTLSSKCGNITLVKVANEVFDICPDTSTRINSTSYAYCVHCPPGSYYDSSQDLFTCPLCPIGEYQDHENETSCKKCPDGTSTYFPGGYSKAMCKAQCPAGFYSFNGVPPCQSCPVNSYSINATYCEVCPSNTKGRQHAAPSKESCKAKCKPGTYSFDGYEPCHLCPRGFYSSQEMQTECKPCDDNTTTMAEGAGDKNNCIDVVTALCKSNPCKNGQCLPLRHLFICKCSEGYSGERCDKVVDRCSPNPCYYGGKCYVEGNGYKCNCAAGTNGKNCEFIIENCKNDTCKNNGICINKINSTQCHCLKGYDGEFCENVSYPCTSNPCKNGVCRNLGTYNHKCDCSPGFKGKNCDIQIDNCASNPCLLNSTCTNLVNDFSCKCTPGYSGKTCSQRSDLCSNAKCNMGTCVPNNQQDTYTCSCDVGRAYSEFCQFSITRSNSSDNSFYMKFENISSKACISKCSEDSQCKSAAYQENIKTCLLYKTETDACCQVFTKECQKPTGNFWTPWYSITDSVKPLEVQEMLNDIGINVCDGMLTTVTQCKSNQQVDDKMRLDKHAMSLSLTTPCVVDNLHCKYGNESDCSMYQMRFQCAVGKVMKNNTCEVQSACSKFHCENGGTCIELTGSCACPIKYTQPFCRFKKDFCSEKSCGNGTCVNGTTTAVCQCHDGFAGPTCSNIDDCKANPCNATGTEASGCQDLVNDYYCPCKAGYRGKNCSENVNECLSKPCFHQGVCHDEVNDFSCKCPDGWTGKQCEKLVDYCKTNRCTNNAVCLNLFKTYYCRCQPNTYGLNCSESVSICKDANPCLNAANCSEFGGKAQCKCNQGFTGVGCQIAVDFCTSQKCANGGTCIAEKNSYKCHCPSGFKGLHCEQNANDCTTTLKTCEQPAPIECPFGKTGSSCNKNVSKDYDLDFYLYKKNGIATLKSAVLISGGNFSISLWVRFKEMNGQGTFLNLFMIRSNGIIDEKVPVLRISEAGITYMTAKEIQMTAHLTTLSMNNGKWNLITITISDFGTSTDFRINNFSDFEKVTIPIINFFGKKCLVILGCYYDEKQNAPLVNKGFYGELGQVNLYSKDLDFKTDITELVTNPKASLSNILVGWGNYQLGRGVRRIVPSTINGSSSTVAQTFIDTKYCPQMVNNYGNQGRTLLKWDPPQFTDYVELKQNYRPGTTVIWGHYAVTYEAKDKNDNVALCNFMVYAKGDNCTKPDNPYEGTTHCNYQEFPYYSCNINCSKDRSLTAPAPLLFTCGPAGSWHPEKTYLPMRFPSCGLIKTTAVSVTLNLEYSIKSTTCLIVVKAMTPKLTEIMEKINAENGFILCKFKNCSDIKWNFNCNDKLNTVQDLKVTAIVNAQNSSVLDILTGAALDKHYFDFPEFVSGGSSINDRFSLTSTQTCNKGEALIQGQCVECTPGTYLNVSTQCDPCPVGTYQPSIAQTSCIPCPANHTTLGTGHMNVTGCKVKCLPGEFFDVKTNQCKKCDIVSYQDLEGQFFCKPCLSGRSTKLEGAKSEDQCTVTCPAGYEFTTNCTACLIGFYRENGTANTCQKCTNKTITFRTGATSVKECNISACFAGSYLNEDNNTCILCPEDSYQNEINQNSCKPCPSKRYRTGKKGAQMLDDCKFFCESGFEAKNKTCLSCPKGTYKDNNENIYGRCKICPDSRTTRSINSTSKLNCTTYKCQQGEQPIASQTGCEPCPIGTYQPEADQEKCLKCNATYSTQTNGSILASSCEVFCDSGFERVAGNSSLCKPCGIGYFKDNSLGLFTKCQLCRNGKLTEKIASISEANCTKANCSAGQYLYVVQKICIDCEYGYYQDEKWTTFCKKCPQNYTTYIRGAKTNTSCYLSCDSGSELVNGKCQLCSIGYYRNNTVPNQMSCSLCDPKYVTEKEGAVSSKQCTVANCSAGFYLGPNNTCLECPLNKYQNVSYQKKCLPCASGFKTWKTGSASCVRICPNGEENKNGVCTKCQVGFYRKNDSEFCQKCPNEFLTKEEGAKNESYCIIPPCKAGHYYNGSICKTCAKDSFQDKEYQKSCKKCPGGKYTKTEGSTKESDCLSYCVMKTHNCSNNSTCKDDPKGFKCECNKNYIQQGSKCIYACDTNYCKNGATCSRGATVICACTKYFDGPRCENQLSAKEVSEETTNSIIGAVVGVLAGILIIILIVTFVCVRMRRKPQKLNTVQENGSFGGTLSTKMVPTYMPIRSLGTQSFADQETQLNSYTNAAYNEDNDPAIFKS